MYVGMEWNEEWKYEGWRYVGINQEVRALDQQVGMRITVPSLLNVFDFIEHHQTVPGLLNIKVSGKLTMPPGVRVKSTSTHEHA